MATVIETRLSARVESGFSVIPAHSTLITPMRNGHERRTAKWAMAKRRYSGRHAAWTVADRAELLNLVIAAAGAAYGWLFKDLQDYTAVAQSLGNAPSGSTPVQLVKTYAFGSRTATRTITRPRQERFTLYQNGIAKAGTLSSTTGIFTPTTNWTESLPLTWTGEFDVVVRFASDDIEFVLPHRDISELNVDLVEIIGE